MKRAPILAFFGAAFFTLATPATAPMQSSETALIATWNMEWFGKSGLHPRNAGDILHAAQEMLRVKADVWALQEVSDDGILNELAAQMPGYEAVLGDTGGGQRCAILYYAKRAKLLGAKKQVVEGITLNRNLRAPVLAYFRIGKFDFYILSVHLKAGMSKAKDKATRKKQAEMLAEWLQKRLQSTREQDYLVCGDFNDRLDSKTLSPLFQDKTVAPVPIAAGPKYTNSKYRSVIDFIAFSPGSAQEFVATSGKVWDHFKEESDHLALSAEFKTEKDDD